MQPEIWDGSCFQRRLLLGNGDLPAAVCERSTGLLTFHSLRRTDRAMQKPLSHRKPEMSQPSSYPVPVRLRVRKCRVQTVVLHYGT